MNKVLNVQNVHPWLTHYLQSPAVTVFHSVVKGFLQ